MKSEVQKRKSSLNNLRMTSPKEFLQWVKESIYLIYEKNIKIQKTFDYKFQGSGNFILDSEDVSLIKKFYEQNKMLKEYMLENAENILNHRFSYFIMKNFFFGEKINWHKDYPNNKTCEYKFYADIDYKDFEKYGDVKYIWEQNRFLHLYKLSQALLVTGEERYVKGITSQIESWIQDNKYLMGVNWANTLEVAIRLIAWSWAYTCIKLAGFNLDKSFEEKFLNSVYQHVDYINNHFSKFSSANNHIIGEAASLVIAGCVFDFDTESKKWIKKGLKILETEIVKQTFKDGLNKEQAPSYHMFVFDFFVLAKLFAQKNGYSVSESYDKTLRRMTEALIKLSDSEFNLPNIGDCDEGQVLKLYNNPEVNQLISMLDISAILFNEPAFKFKATVDEKTLWLTGIKGLKTISKLAKHTKLLKSEYLNDSGYYIFKDENLDAIFDVGSLGYLSTAAHGHADALSFILNYKGKYFLADSGTYAYYDKKEWREYFKGTFAHNTVCVDKKDQSVSCDDFRWSKKADVKVDNVLIKDNLDYIKASHNGYLKQNFGVNHAREVLYEKGSYFIVIDKLTSSNKEHDYDLNWHFFNECYVTQCENSFKVNNLGSSINLSIISSGSDLSFNLYKGSESPKAGWYSPSYDLRLMSTTLNCSLKESENATFITLISFDNNVINDLALNENILSFMYNEEVKKYNINSIINN